MVKDQILENLKKAVKDLGYQVSDIVCNISKNPQFGDYSTNIALQLSKLKSKDSKQTPREIANRIVTRVNPSTSLGTGSLESSNKYLERVEVAGRGFINFFVKHEELAKDLGEILEKGEDYGKSEIGKGKKARVEFISANPTGPLHMGNARSGPLGDVIANISKWQGYEVLREFIDNNVGEQVKALGATIKAKVHGNLADENQYRGEYVQELVNQIENIEGKSDEEVGSMAVEILHEEILADAHAMGIKFDLIVHESELRKQAPQIIDQLEKAGVVKEKDGALWLAPRQRPASQRGERGSPQAANDEFLKDRETVIKKSDGGYTYFTADIVYHKMKFESGSDLVIDIFGSNHHGHVPRLKAAVSALGFDPNKLKVILYQYVRVKRGDNVVKMSKRAGNFITAREVLDEVGVDAFRFYLLRFAPQTHMDFDLDLIKQHTNKNPVYYVQYAHARMVNILLKAGKKIGNTRDLGMLVHPTETALIKHLLSFSDLVQELASNLQVHQLTEYAIYLADLTNKFYENCPVLQAGDEKLVNARLVLVRASKITLANTLNLLGVSAPERM